MTEIIIPLHDRITIDPDRQIKEAHLPVVPAEKISGILRAAQIPLLPASKIGGMLTADQLPAGLIQTTDLNAAIDAHKQESDPHSQYAVDAELSAHTTNAAAHIPSNGISNSQIAAGAAIDWAKISKVGANPADLGAQAINSRLSEIGSLFAAAPAGAMIRKASDGSALEFAVPRCRMLHKWIGTETINNTLTETAFVASAYTLPANTLSVTSTLEIRASFNLTNSANTKNLRIKVGSIATYNSSTTTNASGYLARLISLSSLANQITQASNLTGIGFSANSLQDLTIDFTQNQVIAFFVQLTSVSDSVTLRSFEILEYRQ